MTREAIDKRLRHALKYKYPVSVRRKFYAPFVGTVTELMDINGEIGLVTLRDEDESKLEIGFLSITGVDVTELMMKGDDDVEPLEEKILSAWLNEPPVTVITKQGEEYMGWIEAIDGNFMIYNNADSRIEGGLSLRFNDVESIIDVPPELDAKTKAAIPELIEAAKDFLDALFVNYGEPYPSYVRDLIRALRKAGVEDVAPWYTDE
jgi:hypothetical protein